MRFWAKIYFDLWRLRFRLSRRILFFFHYTAMKQISFQNLLQNSGSHNLLSPRKLDYTLKIHSCYICWHDHKPQRFCKTMFELVSCQARLVLNGLCWSLRGYRNVDTDRHTTALGSTINSSVCPQESKNVCRCRLCKVVICLSIRQMQLDKCSSRRRVGKIRNDGTRCWRVAHLSPHVRESSRRNSKGKAALVSPGTSKRFAQIQLGFNRTVLTSLFFFSDCDPKKWRIGAMRATGTFLTWIKMHRFCRTGLGESLVNLGAVHSQKLELATICRMLSRSGSNSWSAGTPSIHHNLINLTVDTFLRVQYLCLPRRFRRYVLTCQRYRI